MPRTINAGLLDWHTNTKGRWTAIVPDIAPSTQDIIFGAGYEATVTGRKVTLNNVERPSGTLTYATEIMTNTAYANDLKAVGTVKDVLDISTGARSSRFGTMTLDGGEAWNWAAASSILWISYAALGVAQWASRTGGIQAVSNRLLNMSRTALGDNVSGFSMGDTVSSNQNNIDIKLKDVTSEAEARAWLVANPLTVVYELASVNDTEETAQDLDMDEGDNLVSLDEGTTDMDSTFSMTYDGTDYTIVTKSTHVYLKSINGVAERVTGITSVDVRGGRDNVMDLSGMFGIGYEPGTLAEFYKLFPAWYGYIAPYNKGSLLPYKGTGLRSIGFNQFSGVYSETGKYLDQAGELVENADYNVTAYLRVIPGMVYRLMCQGNMPSICWYAYDKTLISGESYGHVGTLEENVFTAPAGAYWCRFSVYVPQVSRCCFYFQWSGPRNGDYEAYWDYTRPLPVLTYFPQGMNGRGEVYDEINERQAIRRFNRIDLSELEWAHSVVGAYGYWTSFGIAGEAKAPANANTAACLIASLYPDVVAANNMGGDAASIGRIGLSPSGNLLINNGSTVNPPTGDLVYEIAVPVITQFSDDVNMTARISDFGTEESLPANGYELVTSPFRGLVLYQADMARTMTKLPEDYQSQGSMDNFAALMSQLFNGTINKTFDASRGVYTYQFIPNT